MTAHHFDIRLSVGEDSHGNVMPQVAIVFDETTPDRKITSAVYRLAAAVEEACIGRDWSVWLARVGDYRGLVSIRMRRDQIDADLGEARGALVEAVARFQPWPP